MSYEDMNAPGWKPPAVEDESSSSTPGANVATVQEKAHEVADTAGEVAGTAQTAAKDVTAEAGAQARAVVDEVSSQARDLYATARRELADQAQAKSATAADGIRRLSNQVSARWPRDERPRPGRWSGTPAMLRIVWPSWRLGSMSAARRGSWTMSRRSPVGARWCSSGHAPVRVSFSPASFGRGRRLGVTRPPRGAAPRRRLRWARRPSSRRWRRARAQLRRRRPSRRGRRARCRAVSARRRAPDGRPRQVDRGRRASAL